MDGLLIDSEPFWRQAHVQTLCDYGHTITEADFLPMTGMRTDEAVALWRRRFGWHEAKNIEIERAIVRKVIERVSNQGSALPGAYELIALLQSKNLPLALASSSALEIIEVVRERLQLHDHIKIVHSAKDEKRGKPEPDVFLGVAKKLGILPKYCVVFEDSMNGVRAAKAAGMKCVAVPQLTDVPVEFGGADVVVGSLREVDWPMMKRLWARK